MGVDAGPLGMQPETLLNNLALLGRLLRAAGLEVGPERVALALQALKMVGLQDRGRVQEALRCVTASGREEVRRFDQVFQLFLGILTGRREEAELAARTLGASAAAQRDRWRRAPAPPRPAGIHWGTGPSPRPRLTRLIWGDGGEGGPEGKGPAGGYSQAERLGQKDFAGYDPSDRALALDHLERLAWQGVRRSHRWRAAARGGRVDLRSALRQVGRWGEIWRLPWHRQRERPRPALLLLDVSGSMEPYAWPLLALGHFLVTRGAQVELFLFGTRLTRVTRLLKIRPVEAAIRQVVNHVPDWSGGTRIGESVGRFHRDWARRVASRGAMVLVVSDGLDRGEPETVAREMARLQRVAYRLIWLNPLLGGAGYQPLAGGMQAALPFVDDFLPMRRLADVEGLLRHLAGPGGRRPIRRQRAR